MVLRISSPISYMWQVLWFATSSRQIGHNLRVSSLQRYGRFLFSEYSRLRPVFFGNFSVLPSDEILCILGIRCIYVFVQLEPSGAHDNANHHEEKYGFCPTNPDEYSPYS